MSNEEIMRKVIEKISYLEATKPIDILPNGDLLYDVKYQERPYQAPKELLIFSHKFAKAFWGEEKVDDFGHETFPRPNSEDEEHLNFPFVSIKRNGEVSTFYRLKEYINMKFAWQYHLQQMVLEEEPIKYLEKFL